MIDLADFDALLEAALGGRVAHSGFLAPAAASSLRHALQDAGAAVTVTGGYPGARRRVVTAHPSHIPEAAPEIVGMYLPGIAADRAPDILAGSTVDDRWVGDLVAHRDGASLITLDPPREKLLSACRQALMEIGVTDEPEAVPLERVVAGSERTEQVVVPSLRVDAIGAKGFRTSRSWFTKGIAAGNVYLNGKAASKGDEAEPGDELYAEGIGWIQVRSVEGETRRGNLKAVLTVQKS